MLINTKQILNQKFQIFMFVTTNILVMLSIIISSICNSDNALIFLNQKCIF